jgi:hypothetical protein
MAYCDASVSRVSGRAGSKCHRIGSETIAYFNCSNADCAASSHPQGMSFQVNLVKGAVILLKSRINLL